MAGGRGLNETVLAQLGALNFFVWACCRFNEFNSATYVRYMYTVRIKYVPYMYNLGTAPNVQNCPGFACCTPAAAGPARRGGGSGDAEHAPAQVATEVDLLVALCFLSLSPPGVEVTQRQTRRRRVVRLHRREHPSWGPVEWDCSCAVPGLLPEQQWVPSGV